MGFWSKRKEKKAAEAKSSIKAQASAAGQSAAQGAGAKEPMDTFNSKRLEFGKTLVHQNNFVDSTDAYANAGMRISFEHLPSGKKVFFKAFITAFNESFTSDWNTENVFGRIDGIHMFKQTTRTATLGFDVPAATFSEAYENLARVDQLRSFLYPTYVNVQDALTINQSPLVRVGLFNLLANNPGSEGITFDEFASLQAAENILKEGALTVVKSLNIVHNLERDGLMEAGSQAGGLPRTISVTVDLIIIHEENMGWTKTRDGTWSAPGIYGLDMQGSEAAAKAALAAKLKEEAKPTQQDQKRAKSAAKQQARLDSIKASWAGFMESASEARRQRKETAAPARTESISDADVQAFSLGTIGPYEASGVSLSDFPQYGGPQGSPAGEDITTGAYDPEAQD